MAEAEVFATEKNESVEETKHVCPRCGLNLDVEFNKLSEELVKDYFKAALTQTPFRYTYKLFGGLLEVVFEEASGDLMGRQEKALLSVNKDGKISMSDAMDFAMLPSLVSLTLVGENDVRTTIYTADVEKRKEILDQQEVPETLKKLPIVQLQSIRNAFAEFAKLCGDLVSAAESPNFWQGDGRN